MCPEVELQNTQTERCFVQFMQQGTDIPSNLTSFRYHHHHLTYLTKYICSTTF